MTFGARCIFSTPATFRTGRERERLEREGGRGDECHVLEVHFLIPHIKEQEVLLVERRKDS